MTGSRGSPGRCADLGLVPGDRVAMLALNSDRYHEYLLAVPWAGGVVTPVNVRWSPAEIAFSLEDAGVEILLVDDAFLGLLPEIPRRRARPPSRPALGRRSDARTTSAASRT